MAESEWVMLLGGTSEVQGKACIEQAHEVGLKAALVDAPEHLASFAHSGLADAVFPIEAFNLDNALNIAKQVPKLRVSYAFKEALQPLNSSINALMGCPRTSPAAIRTIQNKYLCRTLLRENGLPQP